LMKHFSGENQTPQSVDCQAVRFSKLLHVRLNEFYCKLLVFICLSMYTILVQFHESP